MRIGAIFTKLSVMLTTLGAAGVALAQDGITGLETVGKPWAEGIDFQPAATELARDIHWLDNLIFIIITAITIFVTLLLIWVMIRYNAKRNPTPASFTHNSAVEVAWTIIPIIVLIVIGSFSLPILFKQLEIPDADITIKITGNQWYWGYEYPDNGVEFVSYMLAKEDLATYGYAADEYLLATDNAVVVPVNQVVKLLITASDVIHAWKIPAFGVHLDAVPGRLNETWFMAEREGIYFGQCSELCGKDHSYMPIVVKVVSPEVYARWLETAVAQFGTDPSTLNVAQAD